MQQGFKHQFHQFESGLRLVLIPMEGTKTVTVMVTVGTGSKYETKEINGISHFLEHMMFKGTAKRPGPLDISRELDALGASYNAFTDKEMTSYYAKTSAENIQVAMDIVFDIFLNSKLAEEAIQTERHVVVEEINMYNDQPQYIVAMNFDRLLYGEQPAGWTIAGDKETILGLKRQQFVDYFNTHYIAENTVIGIAGNINTETVKQQVGAAFGNIRRGTPFSKLAVIEHQKEPQSNIFYKANDQTHLILGFRSFPLDDDRRYPLGVLANILGGGMSSRLFSEVRAKRGLAYYVSASQELRTDTGCFEIDAGVNNDRALEAVKVVMQEIVKVKRDGVTADELARAKSQAVGRTALALEHSDFIAQSYATSLLFRNKILTPEEELGKIKKVTLEQVHQVAKDIFENNKLNLAVIGPFKDEEPFKEILKM